jgi:quinol monooxygenase YgiN
MSSQDNCCSIVPYFQIAEGKVDAFKELCARFVEKTKQEEKCLYYGFCFDEDFVHCREGYIGAAGVLAHLENVGPLIEEALTISELVRFEIHGPEEELAQLRQPLANLSPQFFALEMGFRK